MRKKRHNEPPDRSLVSLFKALNEAKGLTAESSTLDALNTINPAWLVSARTCTPEEDSNGIDIVLEVKQRGEIIEVPLQVKSSPEGLKKHIQKRRDIGGRFIPAVIIYPRYKKEKIVEEVFLVLKKYFEGKEKYARLKRRQEKFKNKTPKQ